MLKYNDLYKKVKEVWDTGNSASSSDHMKHWIEKARTKWRHHNGGQLQSLTVSDHLRDLLSALKSNNGGTKGVAVAAV
jgi:hypothetical protein